MRVLPRLLVALSLTTSLGCQLNAPGRTPTGKGTRPAAVATGALVASGEPTRVVDQRGTALSLTGKVKLISDQGAGILSNNGGGLISDHGGGLVANNGAGLTSKVKLRVLVEGAKPAEALLSDALVEVMDAGGHVLTDGSGKPLSATTDGTGAYSLKAVLPAENLVLRVRLNVDPGKPGSQLKAILPKDRPATAEPVSLDLDTAATLGTAYVMKQYVHGSQAVFDRLPGTEAAALRRDVEAARVAYAPDQVPDYREDALVSNVASLKAKAAPLSATLDRIEALLLAGQKDLGSGLKATDVGLATALGLALDPSGNLLISEFFLGRVRRVSPAGVMSTYVDGNLGEVKTYFAGAIDLRYGPDGALYVAEQEGNRVRRLDATGALSVVIGGGSGEGEGIPAIGASVSPRAIAIAPDGTLYLGEESPKDDIPGRLLTVDRAGLLQRVPTPEDFWVGGELASIDVAPDGSLYVLVERHDGDSGPGPHGGLVARRKAGESAWQVLADGLVCDHRSCLRLGPDGSIYVSEDDANRLTRVDPQGNKTTAAGTGVAGYSGDGGPAATAQLNEPSGLAIAADGTVYLTDYGNTVVRRIAPDGRISTWAGVLGATQQGDATTLSIGGPAGIALDPDGHVVFTEIATHTVKRFDGRDLALVAGSTKGFSGDGGPATDAQFSSPSGLAYAGNDLYVLDSANARIRKVDAAGTITTVAGLDSNDPTRMRPARTPIPALKAELLGMSALAIGPDGLPYWVSPKTNQLLRLTADGQVELLAGQPVGADGRSDGGDELEGGLARDSALRNPVSLAFAPNGDLYVADAGNLRVCKITGITGPDARIEPFAGLARIETFQAIASETPVPASGPSALAIPMVGPAALAFDADGALYVAETGTSNAGVLMGQDQSDLPFQDLPKVPGHIRRIAPDGSYTTIAGSGGRVLTDPAGENGLNVIGAMLFDREGRLVLADLATNQIKLIPKAALGE